MLIKSLSGIARFGFLRSREGNFSKMCHRTFSLDLSRAQSVSSMSYNNTGTMLAARWHYPSYDIRVEDVPVPQIEDPDDAVVKVTLAGLCGSDLHIYRGQQPITKVHITGHEFIGEVVKLGSNYGPNAARSTSGRPNLYATLSVGDKVVAPFTVNCGECHVCRLGYTGRCPVGALFGSPKLDGGQAQFVRVPKAGGTLYNLSSPASWSSALTATSDVETLLKNISDSSLLLLSDILPTGVFAATQLLAHPKVQPMLTGRSWPSSLNPSSPAIDLGSGLLTQEDRLLTIAMIGLGPVGVCAAVALLDALVQKGLPYRIVAIDINQSRREKMEKVYEAIGSDGKGQNGEFVVQGLEEAKETVTKWTGDIGCTGVLEVVGNNSALTAAYDLARPFGVITSVGVHAPKNVPFTGQDLYNKNISFDFGRCPARAMFPMAFELLVKRQDVFGKVGSESSLIDRVVDIRQASEMYRAFDQGQVGKVLFDPWDQL
ncbi:chaperonin 10-like protein [Lentinula edodes]|uniref:Chaperonin 10-like protein n=1 Tax=Lentinula lateritia TaxID=40482 RepID=A0A9W9AVV3_9AGAR|nr:chaperonin 10-like protein [Lentinula edodes]